MIRRGEKAGAGFLPSGAYPMRVKVWLFLLSFLLAAGSTLAKENFDACKLIAPSEIEAVQGEAVLGAKSGERKTGGFAVPQGHYPPPPHPQAGSPGGTPPAPQPGTPARPRGRREKRVPGGGGKGGEKA